MKSGITWENWRRIMNQDLHAAMIKAGCGSADLKIDACNIDQTWGDLVGFVVRSSDDSVAERAARWIATWVGKRMQHLRTYNTQISGDYRGIRDVILNRELVRGHCVSYCYFPCAE